MFCAGQDDLEAAVDKALISAESTPAQAPAAEAKPVEAVPSVITAKAAAKEPEKKLPTVATRCAHKTMLPPCAWGTHPHCRAGAALGLALLACQIRCLVKSDFSFCPTFAEMCSSPLSLGCARCRTYAVCMLCTGLKCSVPSRAPIYYHHTGACRSFDEDMGSPRAEPAKLLQSKWVMAALAVAVIGVGLYTFRDTVLAGSVNSRLVKVYALLYQVSSCPCISTNCLSGQCGVCAAMCTGGKC